MALFRVEASVMPVVIGSGSAGLGLQLGRAAPAAG
jgi:hypothetical protein